MTATRDDAVPSSPLWIVLGEAAIVVVLVSRILGDNRSPVSLLGAALAVGALLFAPGAVVARLPVSLALVAFLAWSVASVLWSVEPDQSRHELTLAVPGILAGWTVAAVLPTRSLVRAVAVALGVVALANLVYLAVHPTRATTPQGSDQAPGWHGLFVQKNGLGFFALLCIVALLALAARRGPVFFGLLGAAVAVLMLSQSMTSFATAAVVVSVHLWSSRVRAMEHGPRRATLVLLTWTAAAAGVAVVAWSWTNLLGVLGRDVTLTGRTAIWSAAIVAINDRPWHGYGFGALWRTSAGPTEMIARQAAYRPAHAHNGVLETLLQIGWVGLALYLSWLAVVVRAGVRARALGHRLGHAVVLTAIAIVVSSISEPTLTNLSMHWLAVLGGGALAASRSGANGGLAPASHGSDLGLRVVGAPSRARPPRPPHQQRERNP